MTSSGAARELLFAFPPEGDGVRFYLETNHVPRTNVIESYYRLEIVKDGKTCSYRLPHDMEKLWDQINRAS